MLLLFLQFRNSQRTVNFLCNEINLVAHFDLRQHRRVLDLESHRLAVALHVGFIRMSGRSLDSYRQIPAMLWRHLGRQLHVQPPDLGTLRSIYDGRFDTLSDHRRFAQIIANFRTI